ncbi:MAG: hypothetical protein JNK05_02650 [Myxococcales bacterium]|nr:hypothetical protein [Myxococcales bacterium]
MCFVGIARAKNVFDRAEVATVGGQQKMFNNDGSNGLSNGFSGGSNATPTGAVAKKYVYTVTERNERSYWTKLGVGFVNRDGSITLRLDAMPVNGMLQIRDEDYSARGRTGGAQ